MLKGKRNIVGATLWVILLCLGPVCHAETQPRAETILASVNGVAVTARDLEWETAHFGADLRLRNQMISKEQLNTLNAQLIENLIERELLFQHARKSKIAVPPQWVDAALSDLKTRLGGAAALQNYLAAVGKTQNQLKDRLRTGLAVRRLLRRQAVRAIRVSEAEMQVFYRQHPEFFERGEQIRVRHILVSVKDWDDPNQPANALNKIQGLKMRIEKEHDFAVLAIDHSDCPSRIRGGDLGYVTREQLVESFAEAAFALPQGAVSDIVSTRFGYHLIQMVERRPPVPIGYKDVREKIERTLRRNKENAAIKGYVARLKSQAEIQRFMSAQ
ncbi:MAG: hypothetical protein C4519_08890 [Desulfobacteraceae bacterium]|nr:MAG: hypothetical protein C4519_08890 [Desulfobacteraceae bacterium]